MQADTAVPKLDNANTAGKSKGFAGWLYTLFSYQSWLNSSLPKEDLQHVKGWRPLRYDERDISRSDGNFLFSVIAENYSNFKSERRPP